MMELCSCKSERARERSPMANRSFLSWQVWLENMSFAFSALVLACSGLSGWEGSGWYACKVFHVNVWNIEEGYLIFMRIVLLYVSSFDKLYQVRKSEKNKNKKRRIYRYCMCQKKKKADRWIVVVPSNRKCWFLVFEDVRNQCSLF